MLTLITWNVRYFGHGSRGLFASKAGIRRVADALAELDADVIALQEVESRSIRGGLDGTPQLERLLDTLHARLEAAGSSRRYAGLYFPAHRYPLPGAPLYTTGLAVLVSTPYAIDAHNADEPLDITHRRFRLTARMKQTRVCAHVRVRLPGEGPKLDLFNTHLSLPAFFSKDFTRLPYRMGHGVNQLHEVRAVIEYARAHAGTHAVLVGDFNSLPDSPAYDAVLAGGFFRDAFREHHGDSALHRWSTAGFMQFRMHIDHVFSTPTVRWLDFGVTHDFDAPGHFTGISDHVPIIGRLALE